MSDPSRNPLDPVSIAHEEEFFHKKNLELIQRLRHQIAMAEAAQALASRTGIHDPDLMAWLAELGITAENAPILHLVPLLQIAWADGVIQPAERLLLEEVARESNLRPGTPAYAAYEELLRAPPSKAYYEAALIYTRLLLAAMGHAEAEDARRNLQALAVAVARASGGIFGMFSRIEDGERTALRQIAAQLEEHPAAGDVLKKL